MRQGLTMLRLLMGQHVGKYGKMRERISVWFMVLVYT